MTIEIVGFPIRNGDFPLQNVSLPEGKKNRGNKKTSNIHQICVKYIVDYVKLYVKVCFFLKKNGSLGFEHHEQGFPDALRLSSLMGDRAKKTKDAAWDQGVEDSVWNFLSNSMLPKWIAWLLSLFQAFSTAILGMRSEDDASWSHQIPSWVCLKIG